jgi:dTDP-4-dehydrorhamnose reductase
LNESNNLRILFLGSQGLLGSTLIPFFENKKYEIYQTSRNHINGFRVVDLTNNLKTFDLLTQIQPNIIINLAGLTNVELCESDSNLAFKSNTLIVEILASWIKNNKYSCHLIHFSTDQVYDGPGLNIEENVYIQNYYSFSKYAGELAAKTVNATILRTNFFGFSIAKKRKSFTDWLFESLKSEMKIKIFNDIFFSPLNMNSIANILDLIIKIKPIGVFNLGSHNGMSKAEFAYYFAEELGFPRKYMLPISGKMSGLLKAPRPKNMLMNLDKIESALNLKLPSLKEEINNCLINYKECKIS